jgi:predicted Zn-dependent protease
MSRSRSRARPTLGTRLGAAFLALLIAMPSSAPASAQAGSDLPDIGSAANSTLTLDDEYRIGLSVVRGLREQGLVMEDPETDDYIQSLGSRISSQVADSQQRFRFFVVRDPSINAFALPGGFIGINQGLLTATANEAQLASVLAHEIAHVTQRHIARAIQAQGRQGIASGAALLAAILVGMATGSPDAMQAGIAIAQGAAAQQQINFTRANEYEADRIGISLLASAGFDPNAMPDFFETLGRRSGLAGIEVPEFLRTHPVTTNRIAESRDRAAQLRPKVAVQSPTYDFIRERVRVLGAAQGSDLRQYYAALAENRTLSPAQRYGEALARSDAGDRGRAAAALRELNALQPGSPMLQAALGQALSDEGRVPEALEVLRGGLAVAPRNVPLTVRYGETLLKAGDAKRAHEVLLDLFNNVPPTPEQIRLTALAASSAGDTGDAYYYMGEYHISSGDLAMATKQLELALADPAITPVQRARFEARMKEVRDVLKESGKRRSRERPDEGAGRG